VYILIMCNIILYDLILHNYMQFIHVNKVITKILLQLLNTKSLLHVSANSHSHFQILQPYITALLINGFLCNVVVFY
jgi:hypothetical protein